MPSLHFILVQLPDDAREAVLTAARAEFPTAEIIVGDASPSPANFFSQAECVLVVRAATEGTEPLNTDPEGAPLFPVVTLGAATSGCVDTVPPEAWTPRSLARVFRAALEQHALRVENHRLRGDLKTVARRFRHDVLTPISCINTGTCVLKIVPADETATIAEILQNIDASSAEISQLIERVSFVLRASAEPVKMHKVEMGEVLESVLAELEKEIQQASATVESPRLWPSVSGVPAWLQVIWRNLLQNALRHGGPAARIQLNGSIDGEAYRFTIADCGDGVDSTVIPLLFRPFEQLHSQHSPGLGLSLVHRLITLQGGSCGYTPREESGALFHFTLPRTSR